MARCLRPVDSDFTHILRVKLGILNPTGSFEPPQKQYNSITWYKAAQIAGLCDGRSLLFVPSYCIHLSPPPPPPPLVYLHAPTERSKSADKLLYDGTDRSWNDTAESYTGRCFQLPPPARQGVRPVQNGCQQRGIPTGAKCTWWAFGLQSAGVHIATSVNNCVQ